jgi:hypothetical protein
MNETTEPRTRRARGPAKKPRRPHADLKQLFHEVVATVEHAETAQLFSVVIIGKLYGLADALTMLDGWPDAETHDKYNRRILLLVQAACEREAEDRALRDKHKVAGK